MTAVRWWGWVGGGRKNLYFDIGCCRGVEAVQRRPRQENRTVIIRGMELYSHLDFCLSYCAAQNVRCIEYYDWIGSCFGDECFDNNYCDGVTEEEESWNIFKTLSVNEYKLYGLDSHWQFELKLHWKTSSLNLSISLIFSEWYFHKKTARRVGAECMCWICWIC